MSSKFFPEYGTDYSFAAFEEKILDYWKRGDVFAKSVSGPQRQKTFYFYDGPPFATGLPHYGHILAGAIKDIVPRYWTMRGYSVPRRFGWDCHGLPVEYEMEKTLGLDGSLAIVDYGVGKFNDACRGIVMRYSQEWRKSVERMGRWIDMDRDYKTMDATFMESVWWVFKELWDKGLVYEGKKVVPYSWRLTAPLSNFEASQNYKDVQDPAVSVLLPISSFAKKPDWVGNTALVIWTTTPWTLPSNLAVAVQSDPEKLAYGRFKLEKPMGSVTHVILGQANAEKYGLSEAQMENEVLATELLSAPCFYSPIFKAYDDETRKQQRAFRVLDGSHFVSSGDGSGLVHMAPAFGEDDFLTCEKAGIELVDPVDMGAKFTAELRKDPRLAEVEGQFVKDADKALIRLIKEAGLLLKHETIQHPYPFCERSDTPLIYKAISSWFVRVESTPPGGGKSIRDKMVANNQKIHWVPPHIKDGRFGKWLENARDWCISRNRFWGTPIPVWRCEACGHRHVVGSRAELNDLAKRDIPDLHKQFVDEIKGDCPKCSAKEKLVRTPEVLDCWFESGSMPYAQEHYPFENKEKLEKSFPADFIAEGLDQTRGWFYTLTVLSTALFDKPAFKNCIVNGIVLAEDGRKMSKRLKNYPDPAEIFNKYGADALRLYLMQSPAMHAEELRFSEKNLLELMRAVMIPLWNAYGFFASYANIDGWQGPSPSAVQELSTLDKWILARLTETEDKVHAAMEAYKLSDVAPLLVDFIDDLTNWYIRLNRERYWAEQNPQTKTSKEAAYGTLWTVLKGLSVIMAPGLPYLAEILYGALHGRNVETMRLDDPSVHLLQFQTGTEHRLPDEEQKLLRRIDLAKKLMLLGRSLRGEAKIGLRQPLSKLRVAGLSSEQQGFLASLKDLVCQELNIKDLELVARASDLVEESIKPNHKVLGKKVGGAMKEIQAALALWTPEDILRFEQAGRATVSGHELGSGDVQIVRKAKEGRFALAQFGLVGELDTQLTPSLVREGMQREIVNRIQQRRKELKLHLADRITISWEASAGSLIESILLAESQNLALIAQETLAVAFKREPGVSSVSEDFQAHGKFHFEVERA